MEADKEMLITGQVPFVDPAMFSIINESTIARAALHTKGAAGHSGLDADGWRRILVSLQALQGLNFAQVLLRWPVFSIRKN